MEGLPEFKIRCSAIADIMTEGKGGLSVGAKTHCKKWLKSKIYERRVDFSSKYTEKGNAVEEDAIQYVAYNLGWGLASKNTQRFCNDYLEGEPDVILSDKVPDIKSSFSHDTFPLYDVEIPDKCYEWQDLGYMDLTGRKKGSVVYVLMSMPEDMIWKELKWKLPEGYTEKEYEKAADQYRYDNLPAYLRIREYPVEYDEEKIQKIYTRVRECRDYINNVLLPEVLKQFDKYR